jgi:AcrR family transcriptional regulator
MAIQARAKETKTLLLNRVVELLWEHEEDFVTTQLITAATQMNTATIYYHYGSRHGLIDAAYASMYRDVMLADIRNLSANLDQISTAEGFLEAVRGSLTNPATKEIRQRRRDLILRIYGAATSRRDLKTLIGQLQIDETTALAAMLQRLHDRGWLAPVYSSEQLAIVIRGLILSRGFEEISPSPISDESWADLIMAFLSTITTKK